MAYQKVGGTPRFYIDTIQYLKSIEIDLKAYYTNNWGFDEFGQQNRRTIFSDPELFTFSPEVQNRVEHYYYPDAPASDIIWVIPSFPITSDGNNIGRYVAILNHNLHDIGLEANLYFSSFGDNSITELATKSGILNYELNTNTPSNGVSIFEADLNQSEETDFVNVHLKGGSGNADLVDLGSILTGIYYDMPISPDLDLSMEIEFDGANNIKTLNGSTITQANYQGSPWWYDKDGNKVEPWSVGESTGTSKRNGRRVWKLKFSYMSDKDLFASNYGSSTYAENLDGYVIDDKDIPNYSYVSITNSDFSGTSTGGLADGWTADNGISSIVTGNGFTGNAQRQVADGTSQSSLHTNITFKANSTYKISFKYRASNGIAFVSYDGDQASSAKTFSANTSDAIQVTDVEFTTGSSVNSNTYKSLRFYVEINGTTTDGYWIEIDDIVLKHSNDSDFYYTIDNDDSFSAQVLNKISHGEKFIFQPDNTANNPSDFAICVLDGDSFDMKRVAPNVYDIEMTIREVW